MTAQASRPKQSLRERNKERLRSELLDALLDMFLQQDQGAPSIEGIARLVGCSKATVYSYFPNGLNEMLCALYGDISQEVGATGMARRGAATTPEARIMALVTALFDMAVRPRRGKFFAQLNPNLTPALQPVIGQASGKFEKIIAGDLSQALGRDAGSLAVLLVGAMREASIKLAKEPGRYDAMTADLSFLLQTILADGAARPEGDAAR